MRVAVIGSGPSGLACAYSLSHLDLEIDVIDPWQRITKKDDKEEPNIGSDKLAKKSKWNSYEMYNYPNDLIKFPRNHTYPISATLGGLSTVWGANLWFCAASEIGIPDNLATKFDDAMKNIKRLLPVFDSGTQVHPKYKTQAVPQIISDRFKKIGKINFPSSIEKTNVFGSQLAIDEGKCISCGKCLTGCPEDAIFSTEYLWPKVLELPNVKMISGLVDKLEYTEKSKIELKIQSENMEDLVYDKVYVACGALASAALLQISNFANEKLVVKDSQVYYLPIISLRRNDDQKHITLAQAFINGKTPFKGHISIYDSSTDIKERVRNKLGRISLIIPNLFWSHLLAGIGFLPPAKSGSMYLSKIDNLSIISSRRRLTSKFWALIYIFSNLKIFIKSGLIPLPFLPKLPNPGASYHVGGTSNSKGEYIVDVDGKVLGHDNLYVVDSTSLREIPTGPITASAMANAWRIAESSVSFDE